MKRFVLIICVGLTLSSVFAIMPGCSKVPVEVGLNTDLSRQVTDAIAAINDFNRVMDRTPENLRAAADKVIDKLKIEGRDFLAHDARYFTDHTLGAAGQVASGQMEHIDRKMKAYMVALKEGLEEALPKIKAEKSRDKAIELLRNIKINVKLLDPFAYLVNPNRITLNFLETHTGSLKEVEFKSPRIVELTGFGFLRPDDEPTEYRVEVIGAKEPRLLPAKTIVSQSGPFLLQVNLSKFTPTKDDQKLTVAWGKIKLADIPFETKVVKDSPPPPEPPPPEVVVKVRIEYWTLNDDRDRGDVVEFSLKADQAQVCKKVHDRQQDVKEWRKNTGPWPGDWPNGGGSDDQRTFQLDQPVPIGAKKKGQLIVIKRPSTDGWTFRVHLFGITNRGRTIRYDSGGWQTHFQNKDQSRAWDFDW